MQFSSRSPMMPLAAHAESYPISCHFALFLSLLSVTENPHIYQTVPHQEEEEEQEEEQEQEATASPQAADPDPGSIWDVQGDPVDPTRRIRCRR